MPSVRDNCPTLFLHYSRQRSKMAYCQLADRIVIFPFFIFFGQNGRKVRILWLSSRAHAKGLERPLSANWKMHMNARYWADCVEKL